jgi:hypothetical protein
VEIYILGYSFYFNGVLTIFRTGLEITVPKMSVLQRVSVCIIRKKEIYIYIFKAGLVSRNQSTLVYYWGADYISKINSITHCTFRCDYVIQCVLFYTRCFTH